MIQDVVLIGRAAHEIQYVLGLGKLGLQVEVPSCSRAMCLTRLGPLFEHQTGDALSLSPHMLYLVDPREAE